MGALADFKALTNKEEYLLRQFVNSLKVQSDQLQLSDHDQITELLNNAPGWQEAYKAEALMIDFLPEPELTVSWQRALSDVDELSPKTRDYYLSKATVDTDASVTKPLLRHLLNDLHWVREQNRVKRLHESRTRKNVVLMFLFAFILFFAPTILRLFLHQSFEHLRLYYLFTAASAGFLGAAFSQLIGLKSSLQDAQLEQVRDMSRFIYVLARSVIGAGAGLIMFYLLQSGLMEGVLFPAFIQTTDELKQLTASLADVSQATSLSTESTLQLGGLAQPFQDLSLLIIWCMLAGFSEKLIPDLLEKTESQTKANAGTERSNPTNGTQP